MSSRRAASDEGLVAYLRTAGSSSGTRRRYPADSLVAYGEEEGARREPSWRTRLEDAAPLLTVAVACFLLGLLLRATGGAGPVAAFPIWSLFLALGLVATVGAGYSLVAQDEEEPAESPDPAGRAVEPVLEPIPDRPAASVEAEGAARGATASATAPVRRQDGASDVPLMKSISRRRVERAARRTTPPSQAPDPPAESPESMIDEIDQMTSDLRPLRRRAPES